MISNQRKMVFAGVGLAVILGLAGAGLYFTSQTASKPTAQLDTRSRASTNNPEIGVAKIALKTTGTTTEAPMISTRYVGDTFPVEIWMNTGGKSISSLSIRLKYTPDTATPPNLEVLDQDPSTPGIQIFSLAKADNPSLNMTTILNNVYKEGTDYIIDLSAISSSTEGYKTPSNASASGSLLGIIKLKANRVATAGIMFNSDNANSRIHDKTTAQDILFDITPPLQINVQTDTQAPQINSWKILDFQNNEFASGVTSTGSAATIVWDVSDKPDRPADTVPNLTYWYRVNVTGATTNPWVTITHTDNSIVSNPAQPSPVTCTKDYSTGKSVCRAPITLAHGANAVAFCLKDHLGNQTSCSDTTTAIKTATTNLRPKLLSFSPTTGPGSTTAMSSPATPTLIFGGTLVTLNGYNFGATKGTNGVYICTISGTTRCNTYKEAGIVSWSDNKIVIRQPDYSGFYRIYNRFNLFGDSYNDITPYNFVVETKLAFAFKPQGITTDRGDMPINITISNATQKIDGQDVIAKWSPTENAYIATTSAIKVTTPSNPIDHATQQQYSWLTAGNYIVSIKDTNHLRKKFTGIPLSPGIVNVIKTKVAAADQILVGDINNDNKISLDDFSLLMTKYVSLSVPVTSSSDELTKNCDLNKDGTINTQDISLLLSNYKALNNPGDNER